jgi:hypothetical protein
MSKRHREARKSEPPDPFVELARHLRGYAQSLAGHLEQEIAGTSLAAQDAADLGWAGLGATRPALEATLLPRMLLGSAADHLRGVAACAEAEDVVYAIVSLIRPIVDTVASAYFLLDPEISREERVRRWANYRIESLVESIRITEPAAPERTAFRERAELIKTRATNLGFEFKQEKARGQLEPMSYLEPRIPRAMDLSRQLLNFPGPGKALDAGGLVQRGTSAVIHGTLNGILMLLDRDAAVPTSQPGVAMAPSGMTLAEMAAWTTPALHAIDRCALRACMYYGWPMQPWVDRAAPVLLQWREWSLTS